MGSKLLEAALDYAEDDFQVLPLYEVSRTGVCACRNPECRNPGKHPRVSHGLREATTDVDQIYDWWDEWPRANVGVATGVKSRLFAVDVDPIGKEGFREVAQEHRELLNTTTVKTGAGLHLWFDTEVELPSTQGKLMPGVDTRGEGGYVVAPPSRHTSRGYYKFLTGLDRMTPVPEYLVQLLHQKKKQSAGRQTYEGRDLLCSVRTACGKLMKLKPERCSNYDMWLQTGMSLVELDGAGLILWNEWSKQCPEKFVEGDCAERWGTFDNGYSGPELTLGSLIHWALVDNDSDFQRYEERAKKRYAQRQTDDIPWEQLQPWDRDSYRRAVYTPNKYMEEPNEPTS